jgi:hypothetical protein
VWEKGNCVGDAFGGEFCDINAPTAIVFCSTSQIPAVNSFGIPRSTLSDFLVSKNSCAGRSKRSSIVVECAVELGFGRQSWIDA